MEHLELKWIDDEDDKVRLTFDAYVESNISQDVSFVVTKEQLKTLIDLVH